MQVEVFQRIKDEYIKRLQLERREEQRQLEGRQRYKKILKTILEESQVLGVKK